MRSKSAAIPVGNFPQDFAIRAPWLGLNSRLMVDKTPQKIFGPGLYPGAMQ